jgi:hypothetical protein
VRRPGRTLAAVAATALAAGCSTTTAAATTAMATNTVATSTVPTSSAPTSSAPTRTVPTSTARTVTQAIVTGYKSGSPAQRSSGPVTVVVRGKAAASLGQVLNRLPTGGSMDCEENVLLYNITFTVSHSRRTIDVAGYACVAAVQVTQDGKTTLRTDSHCALLAAVRTVLPASAATTRQSAVACDS